MSGPFEDKPRWPGGPLICIYENLPAFPTEAEAMKFHEDNNPGQPIYEKWFCADCEQWHALSESPAPAGTSSGTKRIAVKTVPNYRK